jgi:sorbitol-specific phosphotransferase system component IIA
VVDFGIGRWGNLATLGFVKKVIDQFKSTNMLIAFRRATTSEVLGVDVIHGRQNEL